MRIDATRRNGERFAAWIALGFLLALASPAAAATAPTKSGIEFFENRIRPLLAEHCYPCHSDAAEKLKGGLHLDVRGGPLRGGDSGPAIVPGHPEASLMIEAVRYQRVDLEMPPKSRLNDAEVEALVRWVKIGAPWPKGDAVQSAAGKKGFDLEARRRSHWCWQPVRRPPLPSIEKAGWASNPVDVFLAKGLEARGLTPAKPASKRTRIRRLYFTLIGLPPGPETIDAFVASTNPRAYGQRVDALLASPRFGERWARHWLDLVRYAETLGHEFDYSLPNAWRYRDYVIRAFNLDLPYNQFVREHLAGDLIDPPRLNGENGRNESVVGTAFYWLGQQVHSPVDIRMNQLVMVDNQIDVLSKAFLGLTVSCARCHDHKFDAISTRDYYALYGMMTSSRYAQSPIEPPGRLEQVTADLKARKARIRSALAREMASVVGRADDYRLAVVELLSRKTKPTGPRGDLGASGVALAGGAGKGAGARSWGALVRGTAAEKHLDPELLARWIAVFKESREPGVNVHVPWRFEQLSRSRMRPEPRFQRVSLKPIDGLSGDAKSEARHPERVECLGDARADHFKAWFRSGQALAGSLVASGGILIDESKKEVRIQPEPVLHSGGLAWRFQGAVRSPTFAIKHRYLHVKAAGHAFRIRVVIDNFNLIRSPIYGGLEKRIRDATMGWKTFDLGMWQGHRAYVEVKDVAIPDLAGGGHYSPEGWFALDRVVTSASASPPEDHLEAGTAAAIGTGQSRVSLVQSFQDGLAAEFRRWNAAFAGRGARPAGAGPGGDYRLLAWLQNRGLLIARPSATLTGLIRNYCEAASSIPEPVMVPSMIDGTGLDHPVFIRGNPRNAGPVVARRFLKAIREAMPGDKASIPRGSGRLEMARQIASAANPLTARVMVNRVWYHVFGRGIVASVDNFGYLGVRPTHPELLDWLADWFVHEGAWSVKRLIRLLVTSSAFQMDSVAANPRDDARDPANQSWHKMAVGRLEGEVIRDAILEVAGDLDLRQFGPSVPVHLTPFMTGRGRPGRRGPLDGAGRRSIYLEVRRNFLSPMMVAFDTPIPYTTFGRRASSNVPAQALIMMNDPFVMDQAARLGRRLASMPGAPPGKRVGRLYERAIGRLPEDIERRQALSFLEEQRRRYRRISSPHPDAEAWRDLCHVVFNMKEFQFLR